jgi:hypothetical protein
VKMVKRGSGMVVKTVKRGRGMVVEISGMVVSAHVNVESAL